LSTTPPPPTSPLFPYTTLFRSPLSAYLDSGEARFVRIDVRSGDGVSPAARRISFRLVAVDGRSLKALTFVEQPQPPAKPRQEPADRKSTRLNSSHRTISYAVFC